jgi:Ca-activated chloride channel family protein
VVPAGTYRLLWWQVEHGSNAIDLGLIQMLPGVLNEFVVGTGLVLQGADWIPGGGFYLYELVDVLGKSHASFKGFGPQIVPPGVYRLRYRQSEHAHSPSLWGPVEVQEQGFATFVIDSGVKFIPQDQMPPPYRVFLVNLDTSEEISWSGTWAGQWEPVPVPPGRYRLDWHEVEHGTERMTLADEIVIPDHTLVEVEL